jgi:hypothetical protein
MYLPILCNIVLYWQVVPLYDVKGRTAQCLLWLVLRVQGWVVELGHEKE